MMENIVENQFAQRKLEFQKLLMTGATSYESSTRVEENIPFAR